MVIMKLEDQVDDKVELIKLSASSTKTYDQCPKKYFFNYLTDIPKKQWDHFDLGNFCHSVLEKFHLKYLADKKVKLAVVMKKSFDETKREKKYRKLKADMLKDAHGMLVDYLEYIKKHGMPDVKGVETSFNVKLSETVRVRGFLDRVDLLADGMLHIVDYKTTNNPKYLTPFQLKLYGIWLEEEYGDIDHFKGSYVLLRHKSKYMSYNFNKQDIIDVKNELLDYADRIRLSKSQNIWTPIPTRLCNWCDFKKVCPTQQLERW